MLLWLIEHIIFYLFPFFLKNNKQANTIVVIIYIAKPKKIKEMMLASPVAHGIRWIILAKQTMHQTI